MVGGRGSVEGRGEEHTSIACSEPYPAHARHGHRNVSKGLSAAEGANSLVFVNISIFTFNQCYNVFIFCLRH